jgi:hypothetical protein
MIYWARSSVRSVLASSLIARLQDLARQIDIDATEYPNPPAKRVDEMMAVSGMEKSPENLNYQVIRVASGRAGKVLEISEKCTVSDRHAQDSICHFDERNRRSPREAVRIG